MQRLAVLTSHPIFYQTPIWRLLAKQEGLSLKVFFEKDHSLRPHYDPEFGQTIDWDVPLTGGYDHVFIKGTADLWRQLREGRYDAILVHGWNSFAEVAAIIGSKILGTKVLLHAESPWNQEVSKPRWKRILKRMILGALFLFVDAFLYIGIENRSFYENFGIPGNKLFPTPYAVDNEELLRSVPDPASARKKIRARFDIPEEAVLILTNGKLIPKKRHMDLLRAYEKLKAPAKALVIISEGYLRPDLEKYIRDKDIKNVFFAGFVKRGEIGAYYAAADMFAFTSGEGETWGLVLNEALLFGLPVLVSDVVGSAKDLVHEGRNGWTFRRGDISDLADKLQKMADDKELRREFGEASRSIIRNYTFEKDVEGILAALQSS